MPVSIARPVKGFRARIECGVTAVPGCGRGAEAEQDEWGGGGQRVEEQGTWAAQKHSEAGYGRPVDRGVWTAKTVKRPRQQPAHPQYANYWAPLTRKRHTMPHSAQSQHTNHWAPRTRKRHQQHRPQRPTESSDPTQHAKGRTGDRSGPRKGATTRRNVTQGGRTDFPGSALTCPGPLPSVVDQPPSRQPPNLPATHAKLQAPPAISARTRSWIQCPETPTSRRRSPFAGCPPFPSLGAVDAGKGTTFDCFRRPWPRLLPSHSAG